MVIIIPIHAEFYYGIWFLFAQKAHRLNMARYVLIDVAILEIIALFWADFRLFSETYQSHILPIFNPQPKPL